MEVIIRLEEKADNYEVESMTREAFWNTTKPGCDEHLFVHTIRQSPLFVPQLDFVAEDKGSGRLLGNIMYVTAVVKQPSGEELQVLMLAVLSVLPEFQKLGIGTVLTRHTLEKAAEMGYAGAVLFGHPAYYTRLGFEDAAVFGISTQDGKNFPAFMARELNKGALEGGGRLQNNPDFEMQPQDVEMFDMLFPPKEKGAPTWDIAQP